MKLGFLGFLTLIFITLKLTEIIAWSWLWVLSPLWIGGLICLFLFALAIVICIKKEGL